MAALSLKHYARTKQELGSNEHACAFLFFLSNLKTDDLGLSVAEVHCSVFACVLHPTNNWGDIETGPLF